jgi:hypothetical protein
VDQKQEEYVHLSKSSKAALIATALMSLPSAALAAQSDVDQTRTTTTTQRQEDRGFPWGLLGLLGLAGLLGMKRGKERDIHVDARHDTTRPRT